MMQSFVTNVSGRFIPAVIIIIYAVYPSLTFIQFYSLDLHFNCPVNSMSVTEINKKNNPHKLVLIHVNALISQY